MRDPFASPGSLSPIDSHQAQQHPPPASCVRAPTRRSDPVAQHKTEQGLKESAVPRQGTSLSTESSTMSSTTPIDAEKAAAASEARHPRKASHARRDGRATIDEKAMPITRDAHTHRHPSREVTFVAGPAGLDEEEVRQRQEAHAVRILLFLSGPAVVLSLVTAAWMCVALFITALTQPVRLCARRPNVAQQLGGLLGPSLNLHLRAIDTPLPPHADEDASYHSAALVAVHLLSPLLGLAAMLVAWTLAVYWLVSAAVGDPAGQDRRDDGRESVLWLRDWWERWLASCMREA